MISCKSQTCMLRGRTQEECGEEVDEDAGEGELDVNAFGEMPDMN